MILLSQFQVLSVYAQEQAELQSERQEAITTLDAVDTLIDSTVDSLDAKIKHTGIKQKLQKKHKEIETYIEETQEAIQTESSPEEIVQAVEKVKKIAVLKVVAGVTPTENLEDTIDATVAQTQSEKKEALETIQESLETPSGDYSIIVKTEHSLTKTQELFTKFDDTTTISFLYETNSENYFEVFLREDSIFRQEMLEDIESGILPESFLGIQIVLPEVFSIFSRDITGEDLSQTWGIERYKTYNFLPETSESGVNISVGVVDTGIDYSHPDLQNIDTTTDKDFVNEDDDAMDDQGHGTHVAGTIAANINGSGILGVNPDVNLVPLKICTSSGFCPSYAVIRAVEYATQQDIDILNMSLGGRGNPDGHAICDAISAYSQNWGLVVAAAGNANIDTNEFIPGGCSDALAVAAIDQNNHRASFSNYGNKIDVAAPGVDIYSTYPINKGNYKKLSGTSMAAPHITGLVSLMLAEEGNMTLLQVKNKLQSYPQDVTTDVTDKTIANAVDVQALLASYSVSSEEEVVEEENIAQYIENYVEPEEQYDDVPDTIYSYLDDLTLAEIETQIQEEITEIFIPEIFEIHPSVDISWVSVNNIDEEYVYENEDTQSFSITDETEEMGTGSMDDYQEKVLIPEVIGNGPDYTPKKLSLENPLFDSYENMQINTLNDGFLIHDEVIEGEQEVIIETSFHAQEYIEDTFVPSEILEPIRYTYEEDGSFHDGEDVEHNSESIDLEIESFEYGESIKNSPLIEENTDLVEISGWVLADTASGTIGIQTVYDCTITLLTEYCSYDINYPERFTFEASVPHIASSEYRWDYAFFYGTQTGYTVYTLTYGDTIHTVNVTVNDIAQNVEDHTIIEWNDFYITAYNAPSFTFNTALSYELRPSSIKVVNPAIGDHVIEIVYNGNVIKTYNLSVVPNPPVVYEREIYVGDIVKSSSGMSSKNFSASATWVIDAYLRYDRVYMEGEGPWFTEIYIKEGEIPRFIYKITVKAIPTPVDLECDIVSGSSCSIELPDAPWYSKSSYSYTLFSLIDIENWVMQIDSKSLQYYANAQVQVYGDRNFHIATINIKLSPNIPTYECHIVKGGTCKQRINSASSFDMQYTATGTINPRVNNEDVTITWLEVGEDIIYFTSGNNYYAAIQVYVYDPALVSLQETNCNLWETDDTCVIDFISANVFSYTTSTGGVVQVQTSYDQITLKSLKLWETDIFVKYGDLTIGIIHVAVGTKAKSYHCELNVWGECNVYFWSNIRYMDYIASNGGIIETYEWGYRGRYAYFRALTWWNTTIYVWNDRYDRYQAQIHITVTVPKESSCRIMEGDSCELEGEDRYFDYQVMKDGVRVGRYSRDGNNYGTPDYIKVTGIYNSLTERIDYRTDGLRAWNVDLEIFKLGDLWEYQTHEVAIEVVEAPITASSYCDTRVHGSCGVLLRNIGTDKYTIYVSEPWLTEMTLKRDYLYMKAIKKWTFELLVRNNETDAIVHRGEIKIEWEYNVHVPRPATEITPDIFELEVWQSQIVEITQWNSATTYKVFADYPNISVSKASSSSFKITADNADHESVKVHFIDNEKEYQSTKIYVSVVGEESDWSGENSEPVSTWPQVGYIQNVSHEILSQSGSSIPEVTFETSGEIQEVWIVFQNEDGEYLREKFEIEEDNSYSSIYAGYETDNSYQNYTPYIIDTNNNVIYFTENLLSLASEGVSVANNTGWEVLSISSGVYTSKYNESAKRFIQMSIENDYFSNKKGTIDALLEILYGYRNEDVDPKYFLHARLSKRDAGDLMTEYQIYMWQAGGYYIDYYLKQDIESFAGNNIYSDQDIYTRWQNLKDGNTINEYNKEYLKSYLWMIGYFYSYNTQEEHLWTWSISKINKWIISRLDEIEFPSGDTCVIPWRVGTYILPQNAHCVDTPGVDFDRDGDMYGRHAWACDADYAEVVFSGRCQSSTVKKQEILNSLAALKSAVDAEPFDDSSYEKWLVIGWYDSLKDYVLETIDMLTWSELIQLWSAIKNITVDDLKEKGSDLIDEVSDLYIIIKNIWDILDNIPEITNYQKGYYTWYASVLVWLEVVPALKPVKIIKKVRGKSDNSKVQQIKSAKNEWCEYRPWSLTVSSVQSEGVDVASSCRRVDDRKKKVSIPGDYKQQITGRMDHVVWFTFIDKLEWKKYEWWHSLNEMEKWDYELIVIHKWETKYNPDWSVNTNDYPYRGTVKVKDENGNLIEKSWYDGDSSFFPDNWNREKIQEEVEYAMENNVWHAFPDNKWKWIVWKSKDWSFWIRIQMSEDWNISSFFPDFEYNPN